MNVLYVVHPQQRGVQGYTLPPSMAQPLFRHTVPQPVRMFRAQEPTLGEELEHATVEVCRVEPGVVCPHGWFCTLDLRTAQFVDELKGERAAVVAYLREQSRDPELGVHGWVMRSLAAEFDRGAHRQQVRA